MASWGPVLRGAPKGLVVFQILCTILTLLSQHYQFRSTCTQDPQFYWCTGPRVSSGLQVRSILSFIGALDPELVQVYMYVGSSILLVHWTQS